MFNFRIISKEVDLFIMIVWYSHDINYLSKFNFPILFYSLYQIKKIYAIQLSFY